MPTVSPAQKRLMQGVAHDPDFAARVGIPQSVGKEFVGDDAPIRAAGTLFVTQDGQCLLMKRSGAADHGGEWALPGGKIEGDESPVAAAMREAAEELGSDPKDARRRFFSRTLSPEGVDFSTFVSLIDKPFDFTTDAEHSDARWFPMDDLPSKLHPGLRASLSPLIPAEDMDPEDWNGLVKGFVKWAAEEAEEPEHAQDCARMAFDKQSIRKYDREGRLHVDMTPISKATVNEYRGMEIPDWQSLGLDPQKMYRLFRDPEELAAAAPTFNRLPVLSRHVLVTADKHEPDLVIGATDSNAVFDAPYLKNGMVIWAKDAINGIEGDYKREISCAYRYTADMTPGEYEGEKYDGVMRNIIGNHVAIVTEGRAGPDVVVGDSKGELNMKKVLTRKAAVAHGALLAYLQPQIAADKKLPDLTDLFVGITGKNIKEKRADLIKGVLKASEGIAKDASAESLEKLLDVLDQVEVVEGADTDPNSGLPMAVMPEPEKANDAMPDMAKLKEVLAGIGVSEEVIARLDEALGMAADEDDEDDKEKSPKGAADNPPPTPGTPSPEKDMVSKAAMDAAIEKATKDATAAAIQRQNGIREAERAVRPYIGELAMAFDSAEDVYRHTLKALNVDVTGVKDAAALPVILKSLPVPGAKKTPSADQIAQDGKAASSFAERFPNAARINHI